MLVHKYFKSTIKFDHLQKNYYVASSEACKPNTLILQLYMRSYVRMYVLVYSYMYIVHGFIKEDSLSPHIK